MVRLASLCDRGPNGLRRNQRGIRLAWGAALKIAGVAAVCCVFQQAGLALGGCLCGMTFLKIWEGRMSGVSESDEFPTIERVFELLDD